MYPGETIKFEDGTELTLPRISLGGLAELGERFSLIGKGLTVDSVGALVDAIWISLRRNYPAVERTAVDNGITTENFNPLIQAFMKVNGLKPKETEESIPGNAQAV